MASVGSLEGLPNRIHEVMDRYVAATPDRLALIDDKARLTYRELDRAVSGIAEALRALGIRAGDRMMIWTQLQLQRWTGTRWEQFGDILDASSE